MAGMIVNWQDNPRYLKMIRRIASMGPEQRAILNTAMVDEAFADQAMRKYLQAMANKADREFREKRLGLARDRFETRKSLVSDERDFQKKQGRWGTMIAAANIPLQGYFGYKQLQRDIDEAETTKKFREDIKSILGSK